MGLVASSMLGGEEVRGVTNPLLIRCIQATPAVSMQVTAASQVHLNVNRV